MLNLVSQKMKLTTSLSPHGSVKSLMICWIMIKVLPDCSGLQMSINLSHCSSILNLRLFAKVVENLKVSVSEFLLIIIIFYKNQFFPIEFRKNQLDHIKNKIKYPFFVVFAVLLVKFHQHTNNLIVFLYLTYHDYFLGYYY